MIDEGLRKAVETLSREELQRANKIHPQFVDMHQGYAVIKEEIEECEEALKLIETHANNLWSNVRTDNLAGFKLDAKVIKRYAIELALEAIQVAAVAQKLIRIVEVDI
ncbi:hypothetical protein [Clostridium tagluense]|uniref:hypothetical protein n=1 Tax=Clostridium tagluense TaxID=360422 RepID=UPI001CF3C319|nr:hypothetical protein [Clostridium tagluense]MCB2300375.1 hypothetical protein [Clostridium tagluense]